MNPPVLCREGEEMGKVTHHPDFVKWALGTPETTCGISYEDGDGRITVINEKITCPECRKLLRRRKPWSFMD